MPFIDSKITVKVSEEKKEVLKAKLGATMTLLGKSETYLMVGINDGYDLWMGGNRLEKGAYVSVSLLGNAKSEAYEKMSETKREKAKCVAQIGENNRILKTWRSIADCAEELKIDEKKISACCRGERKTTDGKTFYWLNENNQLIIPEYHRDPYKGATGTTQIQSSSRKVVKIDLTTNEILQVYDTIALAARENNCDSSAISKVCRGVRNKAGGYKWSYID